jgi:hypothetical protein
LLELMRRVRDEPTISLTLECRLPRSTNPTRLATNLRIVGWSPTNKSPASTPSPTAEPPAASDPGIERRGQPLTLREISVVASVSAQSADAEEPRM